MTGKQRMQMKKILLVTAAYTGAGHKSISDALMEQFSRMPNMEVRTIDGFDLFGHAGILFARLYGIMTRHTPAVYDAIWKITMKHPPAFALAARLCRHRFAEYIRQVSPDLILTVHSCFNTILTRMLDLLGLSIPVVVLQADLVNIHSTWCNPRAAMTICPTREAYDASVLQGMPAEKLKIMGLPVRSRFCDAARGMDRQDDMPSRPLRCLLMSGGEGTGRMRFCAEMILNNMDAELTIICGRNKKLRDQLQKYLSPEYGDRVKVLGFVSDPEQQMLRSDLLVTRGSPNTLLEAVVMTVPVVIIGPMPAQEKDNPRLVEKYNLGIVSGSPEELPRIIRELLIDDAALLRKIRASQRAWRSFNNARDLALYIAELAEPRDASFC